MKLPKIRTAGFRPRKSERRTGFSPFTSGNSKSGATSPTLGARASNFSCQALCCLRYRAMLTIEPLLSVRRQYLRHDFIVDTVNCLCQVRILHHLAVHSGSTLKAKRKGRGYIMTTPSGWHSHNTPLLPFSVRVQISEAR